MIEHEAHPAVKLWKNKRGAETRIVIWLEADNYLVILSERKGYILPWTAYLVEQGHQKRKLQRELKIQKNLGKGWLRPFKGRPVTPSTTW